MRRALLASSVVLFACSSSSTSATNQAQTDGGGDAFVHDIVLSMSLTVPAGVELHQCQYVKIPTTTDVEVSTMAHQYTEGSHHFLVWDTNLTDIPAGMTGQYDCTNGDEPVYKPVTGIIYGAQVPTGSTIFPQGVGVKITAGHVVMLNTHFLNPSQKDIASTAKFGMDIAKSPIATQAGFLLWYDQFIDLPAGAKASAGMRCAVPQDVTLLTGFSHYHQHGTGMTAYSDPSMTTPSTKPIYTSSNWEHPDEIAPGTVLKGGSAFRFICNYDNTSGTTEIIQGPNVKTSEMCAFFGLYYPKLDPNFEGCGTSSFVGTGTQSCSQEQACVSMCPASDAPQYSTGGAKIGACWQRCVAAACDGATDALLSGNAQTCAAQKCQ